MNKNERYIEAAMRFAETLVLPSDPLAPLWNKENAIAGKPPKWNYADACVIGAVLDLYEVCGDERLIAYALRFTDAYADENGDVPTLRFEDYNLDNLRGGTNLLRLYKKTGRGNCLAAAEKLVKGQLEKQPRLSCGNFWHKAIYPRQIWLDGAYMALPFETEYGLLSGAEELVADAAAQIRNIRSIMREPSSGLYFHGYDETRSEEWADKKSGLSPQFWLRSMGWLSAALADLAELVPEEKTYPDTLADLLASLAATAAPSGELYQLPASKDLPGNYPETSGTLLFAYAALKAFRLGIMDGSLRDAGLKALDAVLGKFVEERDGAPVLANVCLSAGLGFGRDGSAGYYLGERIVENDGKGVAPLVMACAEAAKLRT